jgi:putative hydrolase of the HAD superfamily
MGSFHQPAASNNELAEVRAIFFDAGNTLVFADRSKTLAPLTLRGLTVSEQQIHAAERTARRYRDASAASNSHHADLRYWHIYYRELLGSTADGALIRELVLASRTSGNWSVPLPGLREILTDLQRKYRLAIISNSDGKIGDLFVRLGLADLFETITDSGRVGVEKPHPDIFLAALRSLGMRAEQSLYIGDVYSIDYLGARAAGMHAVVFDPYGTYVQNGFPRITRMGELGPFLAGLATDD